MRIGSWISRSILLLALTGGAPARGRTGAGEIQGQVVEAGTRQPLARADVRLADTAHRAITDAHGNFRFAALPPGEYNLQVSTVGYWLVKKPLLLTAGGILEVEVILNPFTAANTESVQVTAQTSDIMTGSPGELRMEGNEIKNLASVLADDPLRAVQGLPGVTSDDDFRSQFSLRGAGYRRIGLYLDDILLHAPFHMVQGDSNTPSVTIFNGDTLDSVELYESAPPVLYGDRTAGILAMRSREGSRRQTAFRATASASNAGFLAEGPVGSAKKGSWLGSLRRSYLQYILRLTSDDSSQAFGFTDGQGRFTYDLTPKWNLTASILEGYSSLNNTRDQGPDTIVTSDYHSTLANLAALYTPNDRFLLKTHFAYLREQAGNRNSQAISLADDSYHEWIGNSGATWSWRKTNTLDFGGSVRRLHDAGFSIIRPFGAPRDDRFAGDATLAGAYAQQSWELFGGRVFLSAGGRWGWQSLDGVGAFSPRASASFRLSGSTAVNMAWSQSLQFPELNQSFSVFGRKSLLPERASHADISLDNRLGQWTHLRLEVYDREDRDLLFIPLLEPRILDGLIYPPSSDAPIENSLRGYARGVQVMIQRRTANGVTGWIAYTYGVTRLRDRILGSAFPSDYDQRHTVNAFVSYRLRPTVNMSAKWTYGSGFPLSGFYRQAGPEFFLSSFRNLLRLPYYQRFDFRLNKSFTYRKWQMTLFTEVINALNRENARFDDFKGLDPATGQVRLSFEKQFPILPSAGIALEF